MARKKASVQINILDAIDSLEQAHNISKEYIIDSLKSSVQKAYINTYFSKNNSDLIVNVDMNEKGEITIKQGREIVATDEEILDDAKQICIEEIKDPSYQVGDIYYERTVSLSAITASKEADKFMRSFKGSFNTRLVDAQKKALLELYGSQISEIITGRVESFNKITGDCEVNIGKTIVTLEKKHQILGETFKPGDSIKVCIIAVESNQQGARIVISRSDPCFLKRLFEQEITEVYNGTVVIKDIARIAGVRSKVAVYSKDPNVDACGACIGLNGSKIQEITQHLGNGKEKEKIDVVLYDEIPEIYIAEALVPGHVTGVYIHKGTDQNGNEINCATAITKNGEAPTTIGTRGINATLAYKLTGYKISVEEIDNALKNNIPFRTIEEIKANKLRVVNINDKKELTIEEVKEETPTVEEVKEETVTIETPTIEEVKQVEEETVVEQVVINEVKQEKVEEIKEEIKPEEIIKIADTVKMDDLLSKLEQEKEKHDYSKSKASKKVNKKKDEEKVEEKKEETKKIKGMAIYTDEELEELRRQEELDFEEESYGVDDDDDYDEYDSDDYYED